MSEHRFSKLYLTPNQLSEKYPAFRPGGIRHILFHREQNGFKDCVLQVGRKLLIDEEAFLAWLERHREGAAS